MILVTSQDHRQIYVKMLVNNFSIYTHTQTELFHAPSNNHRAVFFFGQERSHESIKQRNGQLDLFCFTLKSHNIDLSLTHSLTHAPHSLNDPWGITDDQTTTFLHSSLSSAFRRASAKPNPFHYDIDLVEPFSTWSSYLYLP